MPSLGVYYCQQLTLIVCLSLCLSVCHKTLNCFFFFVSRWNPAIFWQSFLHDPLYKTLFFDFWFAPPNAQNLLPKICTKSPESACMADRPDMFGPTRGFWGMANSMEPCKMLWGHGNEIWARRGDPVAYQLVCIYVCVYRQNAWFKKNRFQQQKAKKLNIGGAGLGQRERPGLGAKSVCCTCMWQQWVI